MLQSLPYLDLRNFDIEFDQRSGCDLVSMGTYHDIAYRDIAYRDFGISNVASPCHFQIVIPETPMRGQINDHFWI
jgi:hypothetical protein